MLVSYDPVGFIDALLADGDNDEPPSPLPLTPGASAHFVLSRDPQGRDVVWTLDGSVDPAVPSPPAH